MSSTPPPIRSTHTARPFVIDNGLYSIFTQPDQYPEPSREHEILEIAKGYPENVRRGQYPEVNGIHENVEIVKEVNDDSEAIPEKPRSRRSRICNDRVLGIRSWLLVVLICVIAISGALAVGLAIGIPASSQKHDNMYVLNVVR